MDVKAFEHACRQADGRRLAFTTKSGDTFTGHPARPHGAGRLVVVNTHRGLVYVCTDAVESVSHEHNGDLPF